MVILTNKADLINISLKTVITKLANNLIPSQTRLTTRVLWAQTIKINNEENKIFAKSIQQKQPRNSDYDTIMII
jgi:hypothetical protein